MASFTVSATLSLFDRSSRQINQVNAALRRLLATSNQLRRGINIRTNNLAQATRQASNLANQLARVRANAQSAASALNRVNMPPRATGGAGAGGGRRGRIGAGFSQGLGFGAANIVQSAVAKVTRTAGEASLASQAERSTLRILGYTEEEIAEFGRVAEQASAGMLNVTKTQAIAAVRNLKNAGVTDEAMATLARAAVETEAALIPMLGAEQARRVTEMNIKAADLAGALDDAARGAELLKAGAAAQLVGGKDFAFNTFLSALRTAGVATSISAEGMMNFASAVDEQGRQAGSRLARLFKATLATGPLQGITEKQVDLLRESGISGQVRARIDEFYSDPLKTIASITREMLIDAGHDIRTSEDEARRPYTAKEIAAIKDSLKKWGILDQSLEAVTSEIVKSRERQEAMNKMKQVDFDIMAKVAMKDFGKAMSFVSAQFKDLSASVLDPLLTRYAPRLVALAAQMDKLARGEFTLENVTGAIKGAVLTGLGLVAAHPDIALLAGAGLSLTGAARSLTAAAAALTRSAVGGAGGGAGAGGGRGRGGAGRGRGRSAIKGAGTGAILTGALEMAMGGDPADTGRIMAGSFVGGVLGSRFGSFGTVFGSLAGGEIARVFGKDIQTLVEPLGKHFTIFGDQISGLLTKLGVEHGFEIDKAGTTSRWQELVKTFQEQGPEAAWQKFFDQVRDIRKDMPAAKAVTKEPAESEIAKVIRETYEEGQRRARAAETAMPVGQPPDQIIEAQKRQAEILRVEIQKVFQQAERDRASREQAEKKDRLVSRAEADKQARLPVVPPPLAPTITETILPLATRFGEQAAAPIDLTFAQGAMSFQTINTEFGTTFATGAESIKMAGNAAADILMSSAGGIGNIIGTNAASAILAQVQNLNINVNANVKTTANVDTGAQTAVE